MAETDNDSDEDDEGPGPENDRDDKETKGRLSDTAKTLERQEGTLRGRERGRTDLL